MTSLRNRSIVTYDTIMMNTMNRPYQVKMKETWNTATEPLAKAQDGPSLLFSDFWFSEPVVSPADKHIHSVSHSSSLSRPVYSCTRHVHSTTDKCVNPPTNNHIHSCQWYICGEFTKSNRLGDNPPFVKRSGSQLSILGVSLIHLLGWTHLSSWLIKPTCMPDRRMLNGRKPTKEEIRHFIGMIQVMGVYQLPSVFDYWSQNPFLRTPRITKGMPRDRFLQILRYLHLNDNAKMPPRNHPQYDKLYKVQPFREILRRNTQSSYYPRQEVAVDEAMVLFNSRSAIKQYMPLIETTYTSFSTPVSPLWSLTWLGSTQIISPNYMELVRSLFVQC